MTDPKKQPPTEEGADNGRGPNRGQIHGGQQDGLEGDAQHNQATAVRSSGEQSPDDVYRGDRDQQGNRTTNPDRQNEPGAD
jgi:hypothetical protein